MRNLVDTAEELTGSLQSLGSRRRWPWQPKTVRDYADDYYAYLADLANTSSAELLGAVQRQSHHRRWPWEAKTLRDLMDDRSADFVALAAEWSSALAKIVATRNEALMAAQQQLHPRRWPWESKTLRDHASDKGTQLAARAVEQSEKLASHAMAQRDAALKKTRQQLNHRRMPWQAKTLRDHVDDRLSDQEAMLTSQIQAVTEQLRGLVDQSQETFQKRARTAQSRVQSLQDAVPQAINIATAAAGDSLKGMANGVSAAVGSTADHATATLHRPIDAVGRNVAAGKRRMNRGVRLVRTAFWALLVGLGLGFVVGRTPNEKLKGYFNALTSRTSGTGYGRAEHWQAGSETYS
jgi:ElaB/YqjD/DUF883 family membrane-anchored ribosome-binding protein